MVSFKTATKSPTAMLGMGLFLGIFLMTLFTAKGLLFEAPYEVEKIKYVPVPVSDKHYKQKPLQLATNPSGVFRPDSLVAKKGGAVVGPPGQTATQGRLIGLPKPDDLKVFGEHEKKQWLRKATADVLDVVKEEAVKAAQKEVKVAVQAAMVVEQQKQLQQQQQVDAKTVNKDGAAVENKPQSEKLGDTSAPVVSEQPAAAATDSPAIASPGPEGERKTNFLDVPVDFALPEEHLRPEDKQEKRATPDFPTDFHPSEPIFKDPVPTKYSYRRGGLLPRDGQGKPTVHGIPWDKKLVPKGWEVQSLALAQAALDGSWAEEEPQWNNFFKGNAQGMLSWEHYAKQRAEAARLQKLLKEIVTFRDVIVGMKKSFELAAKLREEGKEDEILPVYGYAFTRYDFVIMMHGLARYIDTGVDSFVFVQNGANPVAEIYMRALQHIFGADKVAVYRRNINMGVSNSWNTMSTHGFDLMSKEQAFVLISNADCIAAPKQLATFAKATWMGLVQGESDRDRMIINRLGEFALFIITHVGWRKLGLFDENLFPAYGEDVEIHIRAVSLGLGGDMTFRNTGTQKESREFYHLHATNSKKGIAYSRPAMMQYIAKKWGVNMAGVRDFQFARPYKHPWNNCRVFHNDSWIIDWGYRDCLRSRTGCLYPVQAAQKLVHIVSRGSNCVEGFISRP